MISEGGIVDFASPFGLCRIERAQHRLGSRRWSVGDNRVAGSCLVRRLLVYQRGGCAPLGRIRRIRSWRGGIALRLVRRGHILVGLPGRLTVCCVYRWMMRFLGPISVVAIAPLGRPRFWRPRLGVARRLGIICKLGIMPGGRIASRDGPMRIPR